MSEETIAYEVDVKQREKEESSQRGGDKAYPGKREINEHTETNKNELRMCYF